MGHLGLGLALGLFGLAIFGGARGASSAAAPEKDKEKAVVSEAARAATATTAADQQLLLAMKQELERSMTRLKLRGYEAPYFISYTLRDRENLELVGRHGAVFSRVHDRDRVLYVEVRVGSYELDNSADGDGDDDLDGISLGEVSREAPLDDDLDALRGALWLLTDRKYKAALSTYAKKRARGVRTIEPEDRVPSFSKEPSHKSPSGIAASTPTAPGVTPTTPPAPVVTDVAALGLTPAFAAVEPGLARLVRESGLRLKQAPILDGEVKLGADRQTRYFVSSEGAELVERSQLFNAHLTAQTRAKDGMLLANQRDFYGRSFTDLPTPVELAAAVDGLAADLQKLQAAPMIDPYTGPAILMEEAAGVFFHETLGHRLEGERQNSHQEGRTFKGQLGKRVLPEFLSMLDDPTLGAVKLPDGREVTLNGLYHYDDEGVPARPVTLIDRGILRDYLKSRTPVLGSTRSNGHARAAETNDPIGRMANLIVRTTRAVPLSTLKEQLLAEVRRQGKPFGLIIRDILGGSTNTMSYGSQTFRGQPTMVYAVDEKTGKETLVRGVEIVGTPLTSLAKLSAASDTVGVFNGFCGAESGMVPVSTVAPAVLFTEIELQRTQNQLERPPLLPPPWREAESPSGSTGKSGSHRIHRSRHR